MMFFIVVKIVEVGLCDGLQNEKIFVLIDVKIVFVDWLLCVGFCNVEVVLFVLLKWVLQMVDGVDVMVGIECCLGIVYLVFMLNLKGFENVVVVWVDEVVIFGVVSEVFLQWNINCSIVESIVCFEFVVKVVKDVGLWLCGSVLCMFGCLYQGEVLVVLVVDVVEWFVVFGCDEIDIVDMIGVGMLKCMCEVFVVVMCVFLCECLLGYFYDIYGQVFVNIYVVLFEGIEIFYVLVVGFGGCLYVKGVIGNVVIEDVLYLMQGFGIEIGIDFVQVVVVGDFILNVVGCVNVLCVGCVLFVKVWSVVDVVNCV